MSQPGRMQEKQDEDCRHVLEDAGCVDKQVGRVLDDLARGRLELEVPQVIVLAPGRANKQMVELDVAIELVVGRRPLEIVEDLGRAAVVRRPLGRRVPCVLWRHTSFVSHHAKCCCEALEGGTASHLIVDRGDVARAPRVAVLEPCPADLEERGKSGQGYGRRAQVGRDAQRGSCRRRRARPGRGQSGEANSQPFSARRVSTTHAEETHLGARRAELGVELALEVEARCARADANDLDLAASAVRLLEDLVARLGGRRGGFGREHVDDRFHDLGGERFGGGGDGHRGRSGSGTGCRWGGDGGLRV